MPLVLAKIALRLAVPLISVLALYLAGEPVERDAASPAAVIAVNCEVPGLRDELAHSRVLVEQGKADMLRAAASMRWLVTLPTASSKRCSSPDCTG